MKKINLILGYLSIGGLSVIIFPEIYNLFGKIAWILLIIIVFSRPLSDILPGIKTLKKIVFIRKGLGILCGSLAIAHSMGYFILHNIAISNIFVDGFYRDINNLIGWGTWAMIFIIPPLITSNCYSICKLGKNRKLIQKFTYLTFIATSIHIYFIKNEIGVLIILGIYILLYILALKKIVIWKSKNQS